MYSNKIAVAVKSGGKILREFGDKVYVPFGSEYSVLVKNQHTQKAVVKISIDGKYVDDGQGFIVNGGRDIEIERFVKSLDRGNKFKFIERTSKVEDHRGIKIDDGLIRIEFQYEKMQPVVEHINHYIQHHYHDDYWHSPYYYGRRRPYGPYWSGETRLLSSGGVGSVGGSASGSVGSASAFNCTTTPTFGGSGEGEASLTVSSANIMRGIPQNAVQNDTGITVQGSESKQKFVTAYVGELETQSYSMVIHLLGETGQGKVSQPITVKHKQTCGTCGHQNKASAKFCSECGAGLEVFA